MQLVNIEIEEKIPYTLSLTHRDETTNLPVDLTGYSAIIQVRGAFGSSSLFLELTSTSGSIILGGVYGTIDVIFTSEMSDTSQQTTGWTRAVYDLVIIDTLGKRIKLTKGFITILRSSSI